MSALPVPPIPTGSMTGAGPRPEGPIVPQGFARAMTDAQRPFNALGAGAPERPGPSPATAPAPPLPDEGEGTAEIGPGEEHPLGPPAGSEPSPSGTLPIIPASDRPVAPSGPVVAGPPPSSPPPPSVLDGPTLVAPRPPVSAPVVRPTLVAPSVAGTSPTPPPVQRPTLSGSPVTPPPIQRPTLVGSPPVAPPVSRPTLSASVLSQETPNLPGTTEQTGGIPADPTSSPPLKPTLAADVLGGPKSAPSPSPSHPAGRSDVAGQSGTAPTLDAGGAHEKPTLSPRGHAAGVLNPSSPSSPTIPAAPSSPLEPTPLRAASSPTAPALAEGAPGARAPRPEAAPTAAPAPPSTDASPAPSPAMKPLPARAVAVPGSPAPETIPPSADPKTMPVAPTPSPSPARWRSPVPVTAVPAGPGGERGTQGFAALPGPDSPIAPQETSGLAAGWGSASSADSTAPIPVAPPNGDAAPARASVVPAIRQLVVRALDRGETEARMLLDPPELGRVRVRITEREGVLRLGFDVTTPAARDALLSGQSQLQALLREQGLELGELQVGLDGDPHSARGHEHRSGSMKPSPSAPGPSPEVGGAESSPSPTRDHSGRVDLVV